MTAILKVDTIQDTSGNNIINESSNTITIGASGDTISIPSGATITNSGTANNFGGGKVLQVVQGTRTSETVISSTSFTSSQTTVAITPSATSSKILVFYASDFLIEQNNTYFIHTLYRGSTNVVTSAGLGQIKVSSSGGGNSYPLNGQYLDSPSSTSQLTYAMFAKRGGGSGDLYINWNNSRSSIVAIEVGA